VRTAQAKGGFASMTLLPPPTNEHLALDPNRVTTAQCINPNQTILVPAELLDIDLLQAKRHEGTEAFLRLIDSIRQHGILQSIGVKPGVNHRWRVVIGNGRGMAAKLLNLLAVPAMVLNSATDEDDEILQLVENMLRDELSQYDQWQGVIAARRRNPQLLLKDIAAKLSLDASSMTRITSPDRCIHPVQDALREGKINLGHTYAIAKEENPVEQQRLLNLALAGSPRAILEKEVKKIKKQQVSSDKQAVKLSRVRHPLPNGVVITVSGAGMSLEQYIESLQSGLDLAKRSKKENLDISTAMRVWADRAKAS
jgi:ParB family transcriptional regulator, chromosome partitioning protein